jgi:hypothetical protein
MGGSPSQQSLTTAKSQTGSLSTLKKAAIEIPGVLRLGDHGVEVGHGRRGLLGRRCMGHRLGHDAYCLARPALARDLRGSAGG